MSEKSFFSIGKNLFNKNHVIAITQRSEIVEVERNVAIITISGQEEPIRIYLPEGKSLSDFIDAETIND